ncbi:GGDEF domain-containing protein [Geodermatophilus sp. CPCC 206100]|uniref:GGDEF domain-containing protein n=1 Tax=Geodermatophilus sp. CPCC 206100 TaxID=3020054 RepID=UPI003B0018D6
MRTSSALRARDPRAAAHSAALILGVVAAVVAVFTAVEDLPAGSAGHVASWVGVAVLAGAAAACRLVPAERLDRMGLCTAIAVGGVLLACLLNLLTEDSSAAAQAFLCFPVLWAASHLRPAAVAAVTGLAVAGDTTTLLLLQPAVPALTDAAFVGAVLVVMAVMLTRANRLQDQLVTALRDQARVDALTGLVNRRVFDEALSATVTGRAPAGTALVLIDVDSFKTINDSHGHPVGDEVLVHLARILRDQVRGDDAVLSRLGGDELAVLLPGCGPDVAARRAEELGDAVRAAPLPLSDGTLLGLSISLGVAHLPGGSADLAALYSAADGALYAAKRAGRGRVAVAPAGRAGGA